MAKVVSLIPENGTEFDLTENRKIIFNLDGGLGFVKGRDSYFTIDMLNTSSNKNRLALEGTCGASSIIKRIDLYSLSTGTHLDTCENYNQVISFTNQYFYDDKTNIQSLEGVGEFGSGYDHNQTGNASLNQRTKPTAGSVADAVWSPVRADGTAQYCFRRYTVPMHLPLFRAFDDERLCPLLMFGGVRMEILLESPEKCLHAVISSTGSFGGPAFDLTEANIIVSDVDAAQDYVLVADDISINDIGLAIGNKIQAAGTIGTEIGAITAMQTQVARAAEAADNVTAASNDVTITSGTSFADAIYKVGEVVEIDYTDTVPAAVKLTRKITNIADNAGKAVLTMDGAAFATNGTVVTVTRADGIVLTTDNAAFAGAGVGGSIGLVEVTKSALVRPQLRIATVAPPAGFDMSKGMKYQFTAWNLFVDTLPSASKIHQQEINSVATKATMINTLYVDPEKEEEAAFSSYFAGEGPEESNLSSVQYFLNNRLYPVQAYNPKPKAEKVISQNELLKALKTINKEPRSMGSSVAANLGKYSNTYSNARELARGDFVFNMLDAEGQMRLRFSAGRANNFTMNTYVWSKKIVSITDQGLTVML
jgi:hypothetical protein